MLKEFVEYITVNRIINSDEKVLLAVSGGIDSMVMANIFHKLKLKFAVAHCKFSLRLQAQEQEAKLVKETCDKYRVPFYSIEFDTKSYSNKNKISIQMAARELRYKWFEQLRIKNKFAKIATAHHLNDSFETTLFNLVKGTGVSGLRGIIATRGKVIRPMLFATKTMIMNYATSNNIQWHEDASNAKNDYSRNLLRNQVVPLLKQVNTNLEKTFMNTAKRISLLEQVFIEHLNTLKQNIVKKNDNTTYIDIKEIKKKPSFIIVISEIVKKFGFSFIMVNDFLSKKHQGGKTLLSKSNKLTIYADKIVISPTHTEANTTQHTIETHTQHIDAGNLKIKFSHKDAHNYTIDKNHNLAAVDLDKLKFPLLLRNWRQGEKFYPLGSTGRKKISDFLTDSKVNIIDKKSTYVLESQGKIVWVIGHRIDDRFKITPNTKEIYIIKSI